MSDARKEFENLLGLLIDDEISASDLARLTELVREDITLCAALRLHLAMDEGLATYENAARSEYAFVESTIDRLQAEANADSFVDKVIDLAEHSGQSKKKFPWALAGVSALAACLAIALIVTSFVPGFNTVATAEPLDDGVAVVTTVVGKAIHDGTRLENGDSVAPGLIEMKSGYLELEFYRGARVTLAGPAKLDVISEDRALCYQGKIRATVPPVAKGFTIATPDSEVVDLGTEFGLEVSALGKTAVHVFDGEVELYDAARDPESMQLLTTGKGMTSDRKAIPAADEHFSDLTRLASIESSELEARSRRSQALGEKLRKDDRLIAWYPIERDNKKRRTLVNHAPTGEQFDGAIVGARRTPGPFPDKRALEFRRPGDRVRIDIPGEFDAITLAAWVRVDALNNGHSSLMLTDEYDPGEIHWQFRQNGDLILGMRHTEKIGNNYAAEELINYGRLGTWMHVATVYDPSKKQISHYLNGDLASRTKAKATNPVRIGPAAIGNWARPLGESSNAIRNFNGRIAELMIFREALPAKEIQTLALLPEPSEAP